PVLRSESSRSRTRGLREDFGPHVPPKRATLREAPEAGLAGNRYGSRFLVEHHGHGLAQFFLDSARPRQIEHCLLLTGLRVSKFVSDNPTRKSLPLRPVVQLLQLGLFLFAADSATDSCRRRRRRRRAG